MHDADVIIVGAGPAGSACAWSLKQQGMQVLLLDKETFPRLKSCAGWITPAVLRDLQIGIEDYPYGLTHFPRFLITIKKVRFSLKTHQYAIRRIEFDKWLLERSGADFEVHQVKQIEKIDDGFVIDGKFSTRYLVGAGGTNCPVYRAFFQESLPRDHKRLILAMEEEFAYPVADRTCRLWFFQNGLRGYAWYVPKAEGYVNVGVGGTAEGLRQGGDKLKRHWELLSRRLEDTGFVVGHSYHPIGHSYFVRGNTSLPRIGNAFLAGDALGLATRDMGEGIGAAIQSGLRAADAIARGCAYSVDSIPRYSFPSLLGWRG
jgi:flavin-dependent dehydrogenase